MLDKHASKMRAKIWGTQSDWGKFPGGEDIHLVYDTDRNPVRSIDDFDLVINAASVCKTNSKGSFHEGSCLFCVYRFGVN